jgi:nucleoside 2-deoxyribosyltransferase
MKVYLAGKWEERDKCKYLMNKLIEAGFEITCDWTNHVNPPEGEEYKLSGYAYADIKGVQDADCLIFYAVFPHNYRGAFVEMGAALGLGKPVYVIGHGIDGCIFLYHNHVMKFDKLSEVIAYMIGEY